MTQPTHAELEVALKKGLLDAQKRGDSAEARNIARLLTQLLEAKADG